MTASGTDNLLAVILFISLLLFCILIVFGLYYSFEETAAVEIAFCLLFAAAVDDLAAVV